MDECKNKGGKIDWNLLARRAAIAVALLMSFRTLQYFPGMQYVQEFWYGICLLVFAVWYPVWKYLNGLRFASFEVYVAILILVAVVLPAWGARREFGQPLIYGILAQRHDILAVSALMAFIAIRSRRVCLRDMEIALLWLAWGTLILYTLMLLLLNPENFVSYGVGFAQDVNGTIKFVLDTDFILFGLIYYTLRGFRRRQAKYYVTASMFLIGVVDNANGRSFMVSLGATLLCFLYRWRSHRQFLEAIGKACCVAAIVLGLGYAVNPDYMSTRAASFSDAFKVVFTGSGVADASATIRIFETLTAWPYIQKNPLLGNGITSHQWEGGDEGVLGAYFYPGDIGVIGVVYSVGVLGMLIFVYQFRYAIWAARKVPEQERNPLADAAFGLLLYSAMSSLFTGVFVFDPQITLLFVAIVVGMAYEKSGARRSLFSNQLTQVSAG